MNGSTTERSVWKRSKPRSEMDPKVISLDSTKKKSKKNMKSESRNKPSKRCCLVAFEELPEYMKDNEYILNYYRADWPLKDAFFSLFRWHNETLNVWTPFPSSAEANVSHNSNDFFSGATNFNLKKQSAALGMTVTSPETSATRWPFFVFLCGSMFCLLSSSTCHLFACHSHNLNILLLRMDYVGIAVMIITSFFPPIFYIFQCEPLWQIVYLTGISVMGAFTIVTLLTPAFSTGKFRAFRAMLFVAMGLFGLVPAVHAVVVNWNESRRNATLAYESVMALAYLTGTAFYVTRIPERWKPGFFDLAGHSHQIFHVFVILGALAHYGAALVFLEFRGEVGCGRTK
ncbi:hypothetical protein C3L33_03722, partial [Rhododendron williamsianum]